MPSSPLKLNYIKVTEDSEHTETWSLLLFHSRVQGTENDLDPGKGILEVRSIIIMHF